MKLGITLRLAGPKFAIGMDVIKEAESLGFDSVWAGEAYGSDAVTPITWVLAHTSRIKAGTAIMQMPARSPAMAAMTAMTLQALSDGRFIMGIGPSGPQVVEGWHATAYGKPLTRTREYIDIVRKILKREGPVEHDGVHYQMPYSGPGATGLGKPLKSIIQGDPDLKIFTAAVTPSGMRTAAEVADGVFPFFVVPEKFSAIEDSLNEGFAKAGNSKSLETFEVAPTVHVVPGDDLEACREPVKQFLALYIGGMGARDKNFYNDYAKRLGYEDEAVEIQNLFLDGKKKEAVAAVPDELVDACALVGPRARIADRLAAWKGAGAKRQVGTLLVANATVETVRLLAEEVL